MNYKEFYKNELFPNSENDMCISDEWLEKNGWVKYPCLSEENANLYYFKNDMIGIIHVIKGYYVNQNSYDLCMNCSSDNIKVRKVSDIKSVIYAHICGRVGLKYGQHNNGGYIYIPIEDDDENEKWKYNEYCKMIKAIENQ